MNNTTNFTNLRPTISEALLKRESVDGYFTTPNGSIFNFKILEYVEDSNDSSEARLTGKFECILNKNDFSDITTSYDKIHAVKEHWFDFNGSDGYIGIMHDDDSELKSA